MDKRKGLISLLLAGFVFGTFVIWIRALNKQINVYEQIVLRNFFVLIFSVIAIIAIKQPKPGKNFSRFALLGFALALPSSVILFNLSAISTKITTSIFSLYAGSIITAFIAGKFIFKEKFSWKEITAFCLALLGLIVMSYPWSIFGLGMVFGFLSGVFDGIANSLRKSLSAQIPKFYLVLVTGIAGIIVSGLVLLFSGNNITNLLQQPAWVYGVGALFGFLLVLVNYLALVGFQNYDVSTGTIIISIELIFTAFFGWLLFAEVPNITDIMSGLCIIAAIVIPNVKFRKQKLRPVEPVS